MTEACTQRACTLTACVLGQAHAPASPELLVYQGHERIIPRSSLHSQAWHLAPSPTSEFLETAGRGRAQNTLSSQPDSLPRSGSPRCHGTGGGVTGLGTVSPGQEAGEQGILSQVPCAGGLVFGFFWKGIGERSLAPVLRAGRPLAAGEGSICTLLSISGLNW